MALAGQRVRCGLRAVPAARYKAAATNLPRLAEVAVTAEIANRFLDGGEVGNYEEWVERAILDAAGGKAVQDYLRGCRADRRRVDVQHVLGHPLPENAEDSRPDPGGVVVTEGVLRLRAYMKWVEAGRPESDGVLFWLEAEKELRGGL